MDVPRSSVQPSTLDFTSHSNDTSNPTVDIPSPANSASIDGSGFASITKKKKKKKKLTTSTNPVDPPASSSSSASSFSTQRGFRISSSRRNPKVLIGSVRQKESDVEALALPLGMSIAAFVAQVLERKNAAGQKTSIDHLSMICTLAIRESLANVFGNKFDCFVKNFEKSFRSTLMTLTVINESSQTNGGRHLKYLNGDTCRLDYTSAKPLSRDSTRQSIVADSQSDACSEIINNQERLSQELVLHETQVSQQLACIAPRTLQSAVNQSMLGTLERSVIEQARSNDLKTFKIGLIMKGLQMKETQLTLKSDSNHLERQKSSFKAEKFKKELKDARHEELLKTCIDCLVAGVLIMLACIGYGTYVYSHKRITDATASCTPTKDSSSWWIPKPVGSFSSGFQIMWCRIQVMSRMLFGVLMIFAVSYLLLQRSAASQQIMPITCLLLLLGFVCGFAGKLCMDTLGSDGLQWLFFWEALCLMHFLVNSFPSAMFFILDGPVTVSEKLRGSTIFPYWLRRFLFYTTMLLFLPLSCGLLPFASPAEWIDHFSSLFLDHV